MNTQHTEPAGQLPPDYIDTEHTGSSRELLRIFYTACLSEGGTADEVTLRGLRAAIAADRAQRQPVPPEPGDVQELVSTLMFEADAENPPTDLQWATREQLRRAADLLAQRYPQPVPVSERLPGPGDCDAEGRCWWWDRYEGCWWYLKPISSEQALQSWSWTHWLTAHALPLPGEVEG